MKPHEFNVTHVLTSEYDHDSKYDEYMKYKSNRKGQISQGNMPMKSKSSIMIEYKYIMKNSIMKRTSTYYRIVKFHDEHMIAHNGIVSVPEAL